MGNRLFWVSGEGTAIEMREKSYEREADLQKLIKENPHLLARAWGQEESRLLFVQQEFEIAVSEDGSKKFFLDHLFISDDGVPILVEVKRSSDTRIRREVVGQMIDYACRAASYDIEKLKSLYIASNKDSDDDDVSDSFWDDVAANLKAEHLRLVFVADTIPEELRIMIQFLDRNMSNIEVYGVELRPYRSGDALLLSYDIIGNPLQSKNEPSSKRSYKTWTQEEFDEFLVQHHIDEICHIVHQLRQFAEDNGLSCLSGHGGCNPAFIARAGKQNVFVVNGWWRKAKGWICTLDFFIPSLLYYLGEDWDEDSLKQKLTALPSMDDSMKTYIWCGKTHLYIELHALLDDSNFEYIKKTILEMKVYIDDVQESDGDNVQEDVTTPPPQILALLPNCTNTAKYKQQEPPRGVISVAPHVGSGRKLTWRCWRRQMGRWLAYTILPGVFQSQSMIFPNLFQMAER